jgi:hypothetical protein
MGEAMYGIREESLFNPGHRQKPTWGEEDDILKDVKKPEVARGY